jgi:hypothetical protein
MYIYIYNYHYLIKTTLCFIWFDQGEPRIRASNDGFIKLQTLDKISLSGLRIFFYFSRESSWLKWGYFVFIKSIKEGLILSVTLQSKKKWNSSSNVLQNLQFLWFQRIFLKRPSSISKLWSLKWNFVNNWRFFKFLSLFSPLPANAEEDYCFRFRLPVRLSVPPSVRLSVRPSVHPSVTLKF